MHAREIIGIPGSEYSLPVFAAGHFREGGTHFVVIRMYRRILDAKLPHHGPAPLPFVKLFRQPVVFEDHFTLLEQARRLRERLASGERTGLGKDPRVADRSAGHGHSVDSRLSDHVETILRRKQIAAAKDDPVACEPFDFPEKLPAARSDIALLDRSAVDRDGGDPDLERPFEDTKKVVATLGRVVDAAPHLNGDGDLGRYRVASPADDLQCDIRLAEMKAATTAAEHLLDGATKVDVDDVESRFDQLQGSGRELFRLGSHQLAADGMLFVADVQEMPRPLPLLDGDQELVEHHLANRIARPMPPRDHSHRPIAVTRQRRLDDRKADLYVADLEVFEFARQIGSNTR